jgi:hypothetical protein
VGQCHKSPSQRQAKPAAARGLRLRSLSAAPNEQILYGKLNAKSSINDLLGDGSIESTAATSATGVQYALNDRATIGRRL